MPGRERRSGRRGEGDLGIRLNKFIRNASVYYIQWSVTWFIFGPAVHSTGCSTGTEKKYAFIAQARKHIY